MTEKPRFSLTLDADTLHRVDEFRYREGYSTRAKAIQALLEAGIRAIKDQPSTEEDGIAKRIGALGTTSRGAIMALLDYEETIQAEDRAANIIPLPKAIYKVSAGTGAYLGPEMFETMNVDSTPETRRAAFAVEVAGDSMEPTYHDGDILLVERREDIPAGAIGVFTVDGDGYVKKRGADALISLNPAYAPIPVTEETICNGLVTGVLAPEMIRG